MFLGSRYSFGSSIFSFPIAINFICYFDILYIQTLPYSYKMSTVSKKREAKKRTKTLDEAHLLTPKNISHPQLTPTQRKYIYN